MSYSACLGLLLLTASPAVADQITLEPVADNSLFEEPAGALSNGSGPSLFVGKTQNLEIRRAVLRFDIAGSVPAGATITGVRVTLECTRAASTPTTQSLHRVLADWGEGSSQTSGAGGMGAPSEPGDATWIHTFFPTSFWANPGGDFHPAPSASQVIADPDPYDFAAAGLVADVQAWLDGTAPNFGWMIKDDAEIPGEARRFASREAAQIIRPMLVIDFDAPSMGTNYCGPAPVNVSGGPGTMSAFGSTSVAANDLTITASSLPTNTLGYFIASQNQGFIANPGGSEGHLCLSGTISRFNWFAQNTGPIGSMSISVDLTTIPSPHGTTAIVAGSTWNFQALFRDSVAGQGTTNLSDGLSIQFQ